jgi:hypothetical protein
MAPLQFDAFETPPFEGAIVVVKVPRPPFHRSYARLPERDAQASVRAFMSLVQRVGSTIYQPETHGLPIQFVAGR